MKHNYEFSVYTKDVDDVGIVFHAHYVEWLSIARERLFRDIGINLFYLEKGKFRFVIKSMEIQFDQPAKNEDLIKIETSIKSLLPHKIIFLQKIKTTTNEILGVATVVSVLISKINNKCIFLTDELINKFNPYVICESKK